MSNQYQLSQLKPGDILFVVHDFNARSPDELSLSRGERIELVEKDDDFGDGWFLGRHLEREDTGLFPAVYTTLAPKPTFSNAATTVRARQTNQQPDGGVANGIAELMGDDTHQRAPSVQPPSADSPRGSETLSVPGIAVTTGSDRSVSAPLASPPESSTPPSTSNGLRAPTSVAQRSISLSSGLHQNSPVMNETLSVIEEHITDMSTPRHSQLPLPESSTLHEEEDEDKRRNSYINGDETDEEENGLISENDLRGWEPHRVAEYLEEYGVDPNQCNIFQEQEISGDVLLGMDQGSLMLKEFELGSIGKRLALWQKIKAIQEEIKKTGQAPQAGARFGGSVASGGSRNRSTSVGTVLPRIPSLMETRPRVPSRQNSAHSPSKSQHSKALSETPMAGHTPRPSAASIRSLSHSRRHSSIDHTMSSPTSKTPVGSPIVHKHVKHGSFDQGWTMVNHSATAQNTPQTASSSNDATESGMVVVNALELDRGYFSGSEADKARNVLKKRPGPTSPLHGRAPSDGYGTVGTKRLSSIFRNRRGGSTDSIVDLGGEPSATQSFYGKRSPQQSSPTANHWKHASASPLVTKLEYGDSPSIDAVATSPFTAGSETSSLDPHVAQKTIPTRTRNMGLRAISDAIVGSNEEKKLVASPISDRNLSASKDSPIQSPGSSSPSLNSRSMDMDEASLLKSSKASSAKESSPAIPRRKGKKATSAYTRGLQHKSPKEAMDGCDYSGWMRKKSSNLMTTWKTRLFILRGTRLSYYYGEDDAEERGLIDISFHRVLPANGDRVTGLHATFTGAGTSPVAPSTATLQTTASQDAQKTAVLAQMEDSGMFIFKLVPPRAGLPKAVNFTKPTVHYFAVDNIQQGRLWMAALMKATIERDEANQVITTYKEKTISLAKAKARRERPPALRGDDDEAARERASDDEEQARGLRISFVGSNGDDADSSLAVAMAGVGIDESERSNYSASIGEQGDGTTTAGAAADHKIDSGIVFDEKKG